MNLTRHQHFVTRCCVAGLIVAWPLMAAFKFSGVDSPVLTWPRIVVGPIALFGWVWLSQFFAGRVSR